MTNGARIPDQSREVGVCVPIKQLDSELPLPSYATPGDAGLDLYARNDVTLQPGDRCLVPTGIAVAIPVGWVGLVHPRSGLASKHGVTVPNSPGTIDSGYRGEIHVALINLDPSTTYDVRRGDRIAQLVVQRVSNVELVIVDELPDSERGHKGFGSTGQ